MECSNLDASTAFYLLLQLAAAIPASRYLLWFLFCLLVFLYNFFEYHLLGDLVRGYRGDKVLLIYNQASEIYQGVVSKCRILHGRYLAPPWLSSPHFQTVFLNFFGNPPVFTYKRQIYHMCDGGTIALDWLFFTDGCSSETNKVISKDDTTPIVVVIPGLTSDSTSAYLKHLVYNTAKRGWNVVVSNHRGLGGISITSDCFYNAGWTEDARKVINHLHQEHPKAPLFAVGTSIGANVLVKYLGEDGENTPLAGAASVCSPWDLVVGDRFISRKLVQRLYGRALTIGLKGYAQLHQPVLSRLADWEGIKTSRSVRDFDNYLTCRVAKFETVDTYYRRCSSVSYVQNVAVPLLCINALDDPLCTKEAIPWDECRANRNIVLATTKHGGHLGLFEGLTAKSLWWVGAVNEFLGVLHSSPFMHEQKKLKVMGAHSSLESSIDKAPYVNVVEDGMVTAVGYDSANIDVAADLPDNELQLMQDQEMKKSDAVAGQGKHRTEAKKEILLETAKSSGQDTPKENYVKDLHAITAPLKKAILQLSRQSTKSMWLLAYIAIVTTFPLVGSALLAVLRNRFKNMAPRVGISR